MAMSSTTFEMVLALRVLQSAAWALLGMALQAWYSEFLPTKGRGALLATYSLGWPLGRAVAIVASKAGLTWRALSLCSSILLAALFVLLTRTTESPRFLATAGKGEEAEWVVRRMYVTNGRQLAKGGGRRQGVGQADGAGASNPAGAGLLERLRLLRTSYGRLTAYVAALFVVLATTTVLIDTWGPSIFGRLMYGDSTDTLPHRVLLLFDLGDFCGILISIAVVDRIGRKGSFYVGFGGQALLLVLLAMAAVALTTRPSARTVMTVGLGMVVQATRCFGWEAAHMWKVEVFPTTVRATAVAVCEAIMRAASVGTVMASASAARHAAPEQCLLFVAAMLSVGLAVAHSLPKETANVPMGEKADSAGPGVGKSLP